MKNKQHTLPSFFLISSAVDGNETAIEKLLLFYEAYILSLIHISEPTRH